MKKKRREGENLTEHRKKRKFSREDLELTLISLPTVIWYILFAYIPMLGVVLAFKNYRLVQGKSFFGSLLASEWVGFENFKFLFVRNDFLTIIGRTVGYNLIFILLQMVVPVTLAILMSLMISKRLSKVCQTAMFFPHFMSWVVASYFVFAFLGSESGLISRALKNMGSAYNFYGKEGNSIWPYLLVFLNQWKTVGYSYINGDSPLADTIEGPEYWPLAPLSATGETNRLTEKIRNFHRFVAAWEKEITSAECPDELNLAFSPGMRLSDFLGTYPLMGEETKAGPGGERFSVESKIDRGEIAFSHDWLDGYEGVSKQTVKVESGAWRKVREALVLAVRLGLSGRMVDLANPCCPSCCNTPLIVPNAGCLETEAFEYLCEYIKNGGKVIFTPMIPQFDLYGNRNDSLLNLLGASLVEMIRPAGGEILDYGSRAVQTSYGQELAVHSWICVYDFNGADTPLASYQGKTVASSVRVGKTNAVVVGFEALYNNAQSAAFWRNVFLQECGVFPTASVENGYFSLFVRKNNDLHFLAVGNAAGTLEPDLVHCAGYSFMLELLPHEGRILIFDVPVLMGANRICYCTSEVIPLDAARSEFELHGAPGTSGKIVFAKPCRVYLNGSRAELIQEDDGYALSYEHTKKPCLLSISE